MDGRALEVASTRLESTPGLTVSQLNEKVREALKTAFPASMWLVGEVSGFDKVSHRRIIDFELVERDAHGKTEAAELVTLCRQKIQAAEVQVKTLAEQLDRDAPDTELEEQDDE